MSIPKVVFDRWYDSGVLRLDVEYVEADDALVIKPIRTPLEKIEKPKKRGWFGLGELL